MQKSCYVNVADNNVSLNLKSFENLKIMISSTLMIFNNNHNETEKMSIFIANMLSNKDKLDVFKVWLMYALNNVNMLQVFDYDFDTRKLN